MELGEYITKYRKAAGITIDELASRSGVPKGTINKIISGATKSPTLENIRAIASALGRSINDFVDHPDTKKAPSDISEEARKIAVSYDKLDGHGKKMVRFTVEEETARMRADIEEDPASGKIIPLLGNSFAAGKGDPDFGNMWEDYEVPADSPAEFAIKINGDSMEPYLPDGSIAFGKKRAPKDGQVAALLLDGEFLVKQVCMDHLGNLYLFALNRDRNDTDVTIWHDSGRNVLCFGTIIMSKDVPLPLQ